jgi:hypothetical protein
MGCRLLLVKWYGDVIAMQTVRAGQAVDRSVEELGNGVGVEVVEVPYTRSSLGIGGAFDVMPLVTLAGSIAAHVAIALLFRTMAGSPADEAREREAMLLAYTLRTQEVEPQPQPQVSKAMNESADVEEVPAYDVGTKAVPLPSSLPPTPPPPARRASPATETAAAVCTHPPAPTASGPLCTRRVVVASISRSSPSCFTDTVIEDGQQGTVTLPCEGDGPVTLRFGAAVFTGSQIGGSLEACDGTEFDWSDGCSWTSAQRVRGKVGSGELTFSYGEAPKAGQQHCAWACTATASVRVEGS